MPKAKKKDAEKSDLSVYSVKTKGWVEIVDDARITKNPNGTFMLRGEDEEGNKVAGIIGKEKAEKIIKAKQAKKDY